GPISSCLAGSVPGGAMSRLRERDAAFRADEIAAAPAQLHLLRVTRAVWFLSRLELRSDRLPLVHRCGRDLEHLSLRAAQTLEPDLARAILHRADPDYLAEPAAPDRTRHHVTGQIVLERVRRLERRRGTHHLIARLAPLEPPGTTGHAEHAGAAHFLESRPLPLLARLGLARIELGCALATLAGPASSLGRLCPSRRLRL